MTDVVPVNGNGTGTWLRLVNQFGVPLVLAAVLLWFVLTRMMAVFDKIASEMDAQTAALQRIEAQLPKH